jgi:ornithine carbamoyltransferase
MKHFLDLSDIPPSHLLEILELAKKLKANPDEYSNSLKGKKVGLYFQKPSMRTRVSFEVGILELGGFPITLPHTEILIGSRETIRDVALVLSRYLDAVMMRVNKHTELLEFSEYSGVPVINGLSDLSHPCQGVADALTILEHKGAGAHRIVFMGDGNNVCHSLIKASNALGCEVIVSCPKGYEPVLSKKEAKFTVINDPHKAAEGADVLYTDVWTSMGQESQQFARRRVFEKYRVTSHIMESAKPECIFMHCLPAHRGDEVDAEVIDSSQSVVIDQAENRLHAQKAILIYLFS